MPCRIAIQLDGSFDKHLGADSRLRYDIAILIFDYNLGVNSFITKPVTFQSLVAITRDLGRYWFEIVELPPAMTSLERAKRS